MYQEILRTNNSITEFRLNNEWLPPASALRACASFASWIQPIVLVDSELIW